MSRPCPSLVIGLGSPHGDDQAGWALVDRLEQRGMMSAQRVRDGVELLAALEGHDDVILVDASAPAGEPGRTRAFTWPCGELAEVPLLSTHGLGLVEALRMAETLGNLPRKVTIIAVESAAALAGTPVSAAVEQALDGLAERLLSDDSLRRQS
ncbi:MAG: hydrogenase maturation protease [Isosphaeraceae bacterium]|nr:hydrogenase maturation protease [Isosphaeraceae bacterium]